MPLLDERTAKHTGKKYVIDVTTEYDELIEDVHDLSVIIERKDDERVPLEEVRKRLKKDGLL
jgi:hypothetical protein